MENDERRGFYHAQEFNNAEHTCTALISLQKGINAECEKCRSYFMSFLINDYWHPNYPSYEELEEFINDFNYEISRTRTLK